MPGASIVNPPTQTSPVRYGIYAAIVVAVVVAGFRFGPMLTTALSIPYLLLILICPVMMFFMMRGMSKPPR